MISSLEILVSLRVNNNIFEGQCGSSICMVKDNLAYRFGKEEMKFYIIFFSKLRID